MINADANLILSNNALIDKSTGKQLAVNIIIKSFRLIQ